MVDTVGGMRASRSPCTRLAATIEILKNHIFNWSIWPDFTADPRRRARRSCVTGPSSSARPIELDGRTHHGAAGQSRRAGDRLPARLRRASLVFTGDTTINDELWPIVNRIAEPQVPDHRDARSATARSSSPIMSKHLCPSMLAEELAQARAQLRDLHHPSEARRDRADDAGNRGVRRAVPAAHAPEQPDVRVLENAPTCALTRSPPRRCGTSSRSRPSPSRG